MKLTKLMDMGTDYAQDAYDTAKDYLPSTHHMHHMAKPSMKTKAKLAKGVTKAMPAKVKHMEVAKMIALPLAGALVALLFAPKSGKELRSDIKDKFTDVKDTGMEKGQEWKEAGVEKAQEWKEVGEEKAQDLKEKYSDEMEAPHGNVHGTSAEPNEDQTIPADKLDETLNDLDYDSEKDLLDENQ